MNALVLFGGKNMGADGQVIVVAVDELEGQHAALSIQHSSGRRRKLLDHTRLPEIWKNVVRGLLFVVRYSRRDHRAWLRVRYLRFGVGSGFQNTRPQGAQRNTGNFFVNRLSNRSRDTRFPLCPLCSLWLTTVKLGPLPAKKKSPPQVSAAPGPTSVSADGKGRIFLIDTMSFIFRAYHAMARLRSMTTKTGV